MSIVTTKSEGHKFNHAFKRIDEKGECIICAKREPAKKVTIKTEEKKKVGK